MYGIYDNGSVVAKFVAPMTIRSNHPVFVNDSLSLKRHVAQRPAQRWEITSRLEPVSTTSNDLFTIMVTRGYSQTVQVVVPQNYGVVKARTGTGVLLATGTVDETFISISGLTGLIPKGTFFKFTGGNKIYMTTADRDGAGVVNIYPAMVESFTSTAIQWEEDVIMNCTFDTNVVSGMTFTDGILMDLGNITFIERL